MLALFDAQVELAGRAGRAEGRSRLQMSAAVPRCGDPNSRFLVAGMAAQGREALVDRGPKNLLPQQGEVDSCPMVYGEV